MKRATSSDEVKKGAGGGLFSREGSGGAAQGSEEGVGSSHPLAASVRGLPPPSTARQVPSWSTSRLSSDQSSKIDLARVSSSPLATTSRLWSFGSAEISPSGSADVSTFKGQLTGMNRWKGDARKPVEALETLGGKADSADSSFGSTLSKKSKCDLKSRANQALKTQFKENLPTSALKQSMSQNNEGGGPMDMHRDRDIRKQANPGPGESLFPEKQVFVLQKSEPEEPVPQEQVFDMHHIRSTILKQEAVFRDQVRELHRVHKVQTLLMAELRRKGSDVLAHPSGPNLAGPSQSPAAFGMSPGQWNCGMGQVLGTAGQDFEATIALPEALKGGATFRQRDTGVSRPLQAANLFKQSSAPRVPPVRRTFDLERPPDDDDDEQVDRKENDSVKPDGNCIKFIESTESCTNEPESDMFSLNLGTGWGRGKAVKDDSEHTSKAESDVPRALKRPREEAALFPFLATKSESLRDAPLRPTPSVANQSFLGGLWGLQLGRKLDSSSTTPGGNRSPDESEAPKKKERLSLNLSVEEEVPAAASNGGPPHWLLKAPAAKPSKKAVCQTESSGLNFQDSFSPPRNNNSDQGGMLQSFPPQSRGESGSGSNPGLVWDSKRHAPSDNPPRNRSQPSHNGPEMSGDNNAQTGSRGGHQAQLLNLGPIGGERSGYGPPKLAQGIAEAPGEALSLFTSWKESGDVPPNGFSQGGFTAHSHPVAGGGHGGQVRTLDGHLSLAAQGLVPVGPAVNISTGSPGVWYQQPSADSHYPQQFQRQQQSASSRQSGGLVSSSRQEPWQAPPMQISQGGGGYGQGTVFAIPATAGPPMGFPVFGVQKVGEDLPGPNWTAGSVGPPFTPFSIVVPPKPPFKRPPKLVLTHDGTTMELKLVSPEREAGAKAVAEKSFSGSSDEELSEKKERVSADVALSKGRGGGGPDERDVSVQSSRGRKDRDKMAGNAGCAKEKGSPASGGGASDWMAKVLSSAVHRGSQAGRPGMQDVTGAADVPMAQQEGMDDADRGSSEAGSGGSGVGDVINPGDRASPKGTFGAGGSNGNLPAGEGEEGVNMGELGLQVDSESQSGRFDRKETQCKDQEEAASLCLGSSLSVIARKISRESSDGPGHVVDDAQKVVRRPVGLSKQLSGVNTSEKDGVQHKPYSPVLRQISSPSSTADTERHAEGSSKKVSQASETDQGNGRSPRRASEWIGPTSMEQDRLCSPGGIDSSCEEVDGTLTSCNDSSITWSELEDEVQRTW